MKTKNLINKLIESEDSEKLYVCMGCGKEFSQPASGNTCPYCGVGDIHLEEFTESEASDKLDPNKFNRGTLNPYSTIYEFYSSYEEALNTVEWIIQNKPDYVIDGIEQVGKEYAVWTHHNSFNESDTINESHTEIEYCLVLPNVKSDEEMKEIIVLLNEKHIESYYFKRFTEKKKPESLDDVKEDL